MTCILWGNGDNSLSNRPLHRGARDRPRRNGCGVPGLRQPPGPPCGHQGPAREAERLQRFEIEARALAHVSHPNIAQIHGVEEVEWQRYLILEYVDGETLADRLDRGAIGTEAAVRRWALSAAGGGPCPVPRGDGGAQLPVFLLDPIAAWAWRVPHQMPEPDRAGGPRG